MQNKGVEIVVSGKSLKNIDPADFNIQMAIKKDRLKKLGLMTTQNMVILDAGCGPGTYGLILAANGNTVIGIDISLATIKMAHQRAKQQGKRLSSNFFVVVADLEWLPLRDDLVDICFFGWALHHFPNLDILNLIGRTVKQNGKITLAEPNESHVALRVSRLFEELFKGVFGDSGLFTDNVSVHTFSEYVRSLNNVGFHIVELNSYHANEPIVLPRNVHCVKRVLLRMILAIREVFCSFVSTIGSDGTDLIIVAQKKCLRVVK